MSVILTCTFHIKATFKKTIIDTPDHRVPMSKVKSFKKLKFWILPTIEDTPVRQMMILLTVDNTPGYVRKNFFRQPPSYLSVLSKR